MKLSVSRSIQLVKLHMIMNIVYLYLGYIFVHSSYSYRGPPLLLSFFSPLDYFNMNIDIFFVICCPQI